MRVFVLTLWNELNLNVGANRTVFINAAVLQCVEFFIKNKIFSFFLKNVLVYKSNIFFKNENAFFVL